MKAIAILLLAALACSSTVSAQKSVIHFGKSAKAHRRSLQGEWTQLDNGPGDVQVRAGTGADSKKSWYKNYDMPSEGAIVSFQVKFDPDFEWSCRGKVAGLIVGNGASTGCSHSSDGSSFRFMWEAENTGGTPTPLAYVYVPSGTKDRQPSELQDSENCGQRLFQGAFPTLKTDKWYDVQLGMRLNKPGKADGSILMSVGGAEKQMGGIMWRSGDETIERFRLQPFHGGPCDASRGSSLQFRDVRVKDW